MTPEQFEEFVATLYELEDDYETSLTPGSWDGGVDVYVSDEIDPNGRLPLFGIQAKRYKPSNPISKPIIDEYITNTITLTIVTTGRFTTPALRTARNAGINLINGWELCGLIEKYQAYDLVEEYLRR